jgi:hypothetical protein
MSRVQIHVDAAMAASREMGLDSSGGMGREDHMAHVVCGHVGAVEPAAARPGRARVRVSAPAGDGEEEHERGAETRGQIRAGRTVAAAARTMRARMEAALGAESRGRRTMVEGGVCCGVAESKTPRWGGNTWRKTTWVAAWRWIGGTCIYQRVCVCVGGGCDCVAAGEDGGVGTASPPVDTPFCFLIGVEIGAMVHMYISTWCGRFLQVWKERVEIRSCWRALFSQSCQKKLDWEWVLGTLGDGPINIKNMGLI